MDQKEALDYNCTRFVLPWKYKLRQFIVFDNTEAVVVVVILGMIVVPVRTAQVVGIVVVPRTAAKHFAGLSPD
jgi:hypothetical protein